MEVKDVISQFKKKEPKPLYLLHGEEPYFIDLIADAAQKFILEEHEKDFNETIVYGKDVDLMALLGQLKQYPMMAEKQLVILREAQDVKSWDVLIPYFKNPVPTTIFIICHKYSKADGRKEFTKVLKKTAVTFESKKLYDNQIESWISKKVSSLGFTISPKATILLKESLGTDLGRISKELEKLSILLKKGTEINEVHIEDNIGISKEYNVFEFSNAIASRDIIKAYKIIDYFEKNPKATHITVIIPVIFQLFERMMKTHFLKIGDSRQLQSALGVNYFVALEVLKAVKIYKPKKIAANIALLHKYDLKAKGLGAGSATNADLLRELCYQLMH